MEPEEINIHEPERAYLTIQGNKYEVTLFISVSDISELLGLDVDNADDCISFVKDLICEHIVSDFCLDSRAITESCYLEYIELFLKANPDVDLLFKQYDSSIPVCTRFLLAHKESCKKMMDNLQASIASFTDKIHEMCESYMKSIKPLVESINIAVENTYKNLISNLAAQVSNIIDAASKVYSPQLSEEYEQRFEKQYVLWGDYGWTSTDFLYEELLDYCPTDKNDANRKAKSIFNKTSVKILFERLEGLKAIKKSDLSEMKDCYYQRNYRACVMISFAMVDAAIICSQGSRKNPNRCPGNKGIKKLKKKLETNEKGLLYLPLMEKNIFHCLDKMFEESNNFKKQPDIINRHFLMHGMLSRKVIKRDAIQAALLVYNLYYLTELLDLI